MDQKIRKKVIQSFALEVSKIIGENLDCIVLYGSQARGDARADSDIDILVVTKADGESYDLFRSTSELVSRLSLENDVVISRAFISKERYEHEYSPFVMNVRREGIVL